jgi:hypothetical protein
MSRLKLSTLVAAGLLSVSTQAVDDNYFGVGAYRAKIIDNNSAYKTTALKTLVG